MKTLRAPAVQVTLPAGRKTFEGVTHFDAAVTAIAQWLNIPEELAYDAYLSRIDNSLEKELQMEDGFTLTNGEFVDREEAGRIGCQQSPAITEALAKEDRKWLDSLDLDLLPA